MKSRQYAFFLIFRLLNAFIVRTSFNPDEYWQSLEVAHRSVFGQGYLTWEWREEASLRGALHPYIFAAFYKVLATLGIDTPYLVAFGPSYLQAFFASVGDVYLCRISWVWFGREASRWTGALHALNWFTFFCMTRTFSNSLEAVLFVVVVFYWPWLGVVNKHASMSKALIFSALGFVIRPTSAIPTVFVGLIHMAQLASSSDRCQALLRFIFLQIVPTIILSLLFSLYIDYTFYGKPVLVAWNFFRYNVLYKISSLYGVYPWHFYLGEGLGTTLGTMIPLVLLGARQSFRTGGIANLRLLILHVLNVFVLSLNAHKEPRFLLNTLPLCFVYAGKYVADTVRRMEKERSLERRSTGSTSPPSTSTRLAFPSSTGSTMRSRYMWGAFWVVVVVPNIAAAAYFSIVHQSGPYHTLRHLSDRLSVTSVVQEQNHVLTIDFLTECHSTPFYSHLHTQEGQANKVNLRLLDCSPTFNASTSLFSRDTTPSARFIENPLVFVKDRYAAQENVPGIIVIFVEELELLRDFLTSLQFVEVGTFSFLTSLVVCSPFCFPPL